VPPRLTNWAGNQTYGASRLHEPLSVEQLQEIVRRSAAVHAVGSRHSFNDVADTEGDLVSLRALPRVFELDAAAHTVTIDGGMDYGELCPRLDEAGFALHNLASLPHISVAGACATATHGSGNRLGNLATAVSGLELIMATGELRRFSRAGDGDFDGTVVALGALGIVTRVTLDVEQSFEMQQFVFRDLPFADAIERFDELTAASESVSFFTEWREPVFEQVWCKRRRLDREPPLIAGARPATTRLHPIGRIPADACTEQLGIPGPWFERLPHFRLDHTPSSGSELQSEYLVAREDVRDALLSLAAVRERFGHLVLVSEVRTVAADTLWLSTAYRRDSAALHFTWVKDWQAVREVLPAIEAALGPFAPRPHWGKLFTCPPERVREQYEQLPAFVGLSEELDPTGKFRGPFARRILARD
jgi:xylitol oxidase